jgi:hypothetical protein
MTEASKEPAVINCRGYQAAAAKSLHPAWRAFIPHCRDLGFGEISQLKIQDGLPVMAEETKKKVKFV